MPINQKSVFVLVTDHHYVAAVSPLIVEAGFTVHNCEFLSEFIHADITSDIALCDELVQATFIRDKYPELAIILLQQEISLPVLQQALQLRLHDVVLKVAANSNTLLSSLLMAKQAIKQQRLREEQIQQLQQSQQQLQGRLELLRKDLQAGRYVQQKLLPASPKIIHHISCEHRVMPSLYLSGDFVDYMSIGSQQLLFCVADVAGHGASSAFITVLIKHVLAAIRSTSNQSPRLQLSPDSVLQQLNTEMLTLQLGRHVTLILGVIDIANGQLHYSLAGHLPPPILYNAGESQYLLSGGPPVGLFDSPQYTVRSVDLGTKWSITCFSDGIFERLEARSLRDCEVELLQRCPSPVESLQQLETVFALQIDTQLEDDISVLTIRNF